MISFRRFLPPQIALVICLVAAASSARDQSGSPAWIKLKPAGTPPSPRADAAAVYAANVNQMIVFGGNPSGCTSAPSLNDSGF